MIIAGYIISILYALLCIAGAGVLYKVGVPKSVTRKFVHILVGFEWVILNFFMGPTPHFFAVALILTLALAVEYRLKLFKMMSSDSDNAPGTVYYAVAMSIMSAVTCFLPEMSIPFGIGVFCTSFGDGFAGLVGSLVKRGNPRIYGNKTLVGTLVATSVSLVTTVALSLICSYPLAWWQCLAIAFLSASLELLFGRGLDNLAVTLGTAGLAYAFVYFPAVSDYLVPLLLTPLFIGFAYEKKALTTDGILAAIAIDVAISVALGNFGFVLLASFFVGGIITDKFKKSRNKSKQKEKCKSESRDSVQVLANAFVAAVAAVLFLWMKNELLVVAFVAAMSEALADTAASGIGSSSTRVYDLLRLRRCEPGLSGGVSASGTVAAAIASLLLPAIALVFGVIGIAGAVIAAVAAFIGVMLDSAFGSLLQAKYRCPSCDRTVERAEHCGERCTRISGLAFVDNDVVNLASNFLSAVIGVLICLPIL